MPEVPNFLAKRASLTPERVAIETEKEKITFIQLHNRSLHLASKLSAMGVKKGDAVSVWMQNSIELAVLIFALKHIGAVTVLHNFKLTSEELSFQMKDAKSVLLIMDQSKKEELVLHPLFSNDSLLSMEEIISQSGVPIEFQEEFELESIDTIMYTSGTTGFPKGVKQTYGNHFWSATGSALNLSLQEDDCWLLAVPIFHISGLSILIRGIIYGMRVLLHEKFIASRVNNDIIEKGVTIASVVTTMLNALLEEMADCVYPPSFRCMLVGGGPVPLSMLEKCQRKRIPVYQTYGMTETCSQIVTLVPEAALQKLGSAGKPLFPCQLKILENGKDALPNQAGEIVVKGPNVTPGYFNKEDATKKAIINGWLHTGDIGYLDEEGYLYVLDRRNDLIISGGENIYPAEIESALLSHPSVKDAGVTGIADEKWGQVPIAFMVPNGIEVSEAEIVDYLSKRLAGYKIPKRILTVKELPRNASNKLLRRKLLDLMPSSSVRSDDK